MVADKILAVNIGNTNISAGLFDNGSIVSHCRVSVSDFSQKKDLADMWCEELDFSVIKDVVAASVNPEAEYLFSKWLKDQYNKKPVTIGKDLLPKITMKVNNAMTVGIDRILNAVAGYRFMGKGTIIIDLGTAITFDIVSDSGAFIGGVISPGAAMCSKALNEQTCQLPYVPIRRAEKAVGKDTISAILSGIYWGMIGSINKIVKELSNEINFEPAIIATGGDAELFAEHINGLEKIYPHLTLEGINIVYDETRQ